MSAQLNEDSDDALVFHDDGLPEEALVVDPNLPPWKVLVIDDDPSVHEITDVVMDRVSYRRRALTLLKAYSAAEGQQMLHQHPDVAVILLDVVMETDDAGLELARIIREEMDNQHVRIILRTGQPGQAPERRVIVQYDINDYKAKTELTSQKLFTATIAALRSYSDMMEVVAYQRGLEEVLDASAAVFAQDSLAAMAQVAMNRLAQMMDHKGDAFFCSRPSRQDGPIMLVGGGGAYTQTDFVPWEHHVGPALRKKLEQLITRADGVERMDDGALVVCKSSPSNTVGLCYFANGTGPNSLMDSLLELFVDRSAAGFDTALLQDQLRRHHTELEQTVAQRTRELRQANADLRKAQHKIQEELQVAQALQQAIVSVRFPQDKRYEGYAMMRAARNVGGDFYDIIPLEDGRIGLVLADVCGKGVPAAIFMSMSRSILRSVAVDGCEPHECLARTNELLAEQNPTELFVSACYAVLDPATGALHYANGGHDLPFCRSIHGTVSRLEPVKGMILGMVPGATFQRGVHMLQPDEELYLFTDGITEAINKDGAFFGEERAQEWIADRPSGPVELIADALVAAVTQFSHPQEQTDDITCMALRYKG